MKTVNFESHVKRYPQPQVHVKLEDIKQQRQYKKIDSSVRFYSLKDFDTCEHVEEFLEKIKEEISKDISNNNVVTKASLFLQDFPSEGKLDMKYIFNIFTVTLRLRSLSILEIQGNIN